MNQTEAAGVQGTNPGVIPGAPPHRKSSLRRARCWVAAVCLGALLLTACSTPPELDEGAAGELQTRVAAAKRLAAQQNFPAALAELQQLSEKVRTAEEQGLMSQERKTRIEASISKVRADLETAMTPAEPQPATSAPAAEPPDNEGKDQKEDAKKKAEKQQEEAKKEAEKEKDQDDVNG